MGAIEIVVNGALRADAAVGPHVSLLDWLRAQGWTGAKEGCAEGECGSCAVLVARTDGPGRSRWTSVNACLPPAAAFDGQELVTAEGLGAPPTAGSSAALHPVQRALADGGGSQCGYCTPGFVCAMAAEYYRPGRSDDEAAGDDDERGPNGFDLHALGGNLCRCTGYRPICDAAYGLGGPSGEDPLLRRLDREAPPPRATRLRASTGAYLRPGTLTEALALLADEPDAVLLAGGTDLGVERNLRHTRAPLVVGIERLDALRELRIGDDAIELGAALTLSEIERALAGRVPILDELFVRFASRLIRNAATLGGNLGTGSPIGDAAPVLLALDATLVLASARGERTVPLAAYFTGYRQSVLAADELIRAIRIPLPIAPLTSFQKIAKRRFDDISSVAVAIAITLEQGTVASARIGLGGVAATPLRARNTEAALLGRPWDAATVLRAAAVLRDEGTPMDDHRASARYRSAMLERSLLRLQPEE